MGRRRVAAAAIVVALVAVVGCTRPAGEVEIGAAPAAGGATAQAPAQQASGGGGQEPIQAAIANGDFGTLKGVCGPKGAEPKGGATAPGVTADSITVGTFSDPNNKFRPGVNQELFDVADVFTAWCNDLGGINGRTLELNKHDSALFNYQARMVEACRTDFMLVGGGAVFDNQGQDERLDCLLVAFPGYVVTPEARGADLIVSPNPQRITDINFGIGPYVSETFPESVGHVGLLTANIPATVFVADQYRQAGEQLGWTFAYDAQYNAQGEPTWVPFAQKMQSEGVRGVLYVGEPENLAQLVQAFAQINYHVDWIAGAANMYDVKLTDGAGAALDSVPVYLWNQLAPFEYTDRIPALQEYQALFDKYKPEGKSHASLVLNSMSAWLLWAQSVKSCGDHVTRRCVYEAGKQTTDWTAGGLQAPTDLSADRSNECTVIIKATGQGFEVQEWNPNTDFYNCDPRNVVNVQGFEEQGVKLEDVGKSYEDLK